jgi:hypothetical protein
MDARYQLRVAGTAAGLMLVAALLFAGAIHLEIARLHQIVSVHDPNIARALQDRGLTDLVLVGVLAVGLTFGTLLLALLETNRVANCANSLRLALERMQRGDYATPTNLRRTDCLDALAASVGELRGTLARESTEEAELLESLADRAEALKGEEEAACLGAELRDHAARKRVPPGL